MADEPLVSVVVPAFNAEATLAETLDSALAQTWPNLEIVVVDDGSTDGTRAIAEAYARRHPTVRLVAQANAGVSAARNAGIAAARGDYIAPLDADDLWHPDKIARQMEAALAAPQVGLVHCLHRTIDLGGRITGSQPPVLFEGRAPCRYALSNVASPGSNPLFRRAVVEAAGGYDPAFGWGEDFLLHVKIVAAAGAAAVPAYLVGYRQRPGSLSTDRAAIRAEWPRVRAELHRLLPELPDRAWRWIDGPRAARQAEGAAWSGQWGTCARLLGRAVLRDPHWTLAWLAHRVRRRLGPRRPAPPPGPHFLEAPVEIGTGPPPASDAGPLLLRIEAARRARLGALDARC